MGVFVGELVVNGFEVEVNGALHAEGRGVDGLWGSDEGLAGKRAEGDLENDLAVDQGGDASEERDLGLEG